MLFLQAFTKMCDNPNSRSADIGKRRLHGTNSDVKVEPMDEGCAKHVGLQLHSGHTFNLHDSGAIKTEPLELTSTGSSNDMLGTDVTEASHLLRQYVPTEQYAGYNTEVDKYMDTSGCTTNVHENCKTELYCQLTPTVVKTDHYYASDSDYSEPMGRDVSSDHIKSEPPDITDTETISYYDYEQSSDRIGGETEFDLKTEAQESSILGGMRNESELEIKTDLSDPDILDVIKTDPNSDIVVIKKEPDTDMSLVFKNEPDTDILGVIKTEPGGPPGPPLSVLSSLDAYDNEAQVSVSITSMVTYNWAQIEKGLKTEEEAATDIESDGNTVQGLLESSSS
jgi:hypothetical protein